MVTEVILVSTPIECNRFGDCPLPYQAGKALVHGLHSVDRAGLNQRIDLVRLATSDQVANAGCADHHLRSHHAAIPFRIDD